jgi:5-methylcytosine-specific restriction endonuclease McrA
MTRSKGRASQGWLVQAVHVDEPDITSAAHLALLAKHYFSLDRSIYTDWRMAHIRRKWMKQQLKHPDELGGLTCAICGKKGLKPYKQPDVPTNDMATLDHIIEIGRGGSWNDPTNFQVACVHCNSTKNSMLQKAEKSRLTFYRGTV